MPEKNRLFIIWRTFFQHKEASVNQNSSSDVKGSLGHHLDRKRFFYGIVKSEQVSLNESYQDCEWDLRAVMFISLYLVFLELHCM